ncbi:MULTISPECIES: hypothetical protein [Haloferax]|uniref:Uncharacterized protein n=1 Tax=Haloferax marinum TaxID=2666143 RepID=A0A6A8G3Z8_9EURY|nr:MULTISPECIES: hypothetical protein [Haloferax]KAB1196922.1 hypothetical protein Hfx1150_05060 [Haloferax sp. CBA1150]MRW95940.1 hypothetical protein [Haloferax marinum]
MPDPATVGRALTALAYPDDGPERQGYQRTIADARDAFSDLDTAAQFLDDDGEATLRRAVGAASRDDHSCARDGRRLLRDLSRLRESIADAPPSTPGDGDHFHSGRTTVFSGAGESPDR